MALAQTTKVMLVGDSITHGDGGIGYRYFLSRNLIDAGFTDVDLVGPHSTPYELDPGDLENDYPLPYDPDHEGHAGWQTSTHLQNDHLKGSMQAYNPDIVSIMLGTNDLGANPGNPNAEQTAIRNMSRIVRQLRVVNPNVKVLLTQIVPIQEGAYNNQGHRVPGYNTMLADFAQTNTTADSPILLVDQYTGFDAKAMMYDGIHPNVFGEQLVGDRFFAALQPLFNPGEPVVSPKPTVHNAGFEAHDSFDGGIASSLRGTGLQGTAFVFGNTGSGGVESDSGLYNPTGATYTGAEGIDGTPQGAEGSLVGFVSNGTPLADDSQKAAITQQLSHLLQADTEYTMSVAVGNRAAGNPYGSSYGGYVIELLAGDTVIGSAVDSTLAMAPPSGVFSDVVLSVNTGDLDPQLLGKELQIRLRIGTLLADHATDFDNVRLTAAPAAVPEPGAIGMAALVLLGMGLRRPSSAADPR